MCESKLSGIHVLQWSLKYFHFLTEKIIKIANFEPTRVFGNTDYNQVSAIDANYSFCGWFVLSKGY